MDISKIPALRIDATDEELKLVGELCGIQAQVEHFMQWSVEHLLGVKREVVQKILGSTVLGTNAAVWLSIVRAKSAEDHVKNLAQFAYAKVISLSTGRNDFIHALYTYAPNADGTRFVPSAVRVKSGKYRPLTELRSVRDEAAVLSHLMAHLNWCVMPPDQKEDARRLFWRSPWLDILPSELHPDLATAKTLKAQEHRLPEPRLPLPE